MPVSAATLKALIDAGVTGDALVAVVAAIDADMAAAPPLPAPERSGAARRQAAYRERKHNASITESITPTVTQGITVTSQPITNVTPRVSARAEPETTNSSSPPEDQKGKEGRKIPPAAVREPTGKHLLPANWQPSDELVAYGMNLGHSRQRCAEIAEDMRVWAQGKGERRADWPATYQGFLRRESRGGNTHRGPPPRSRKPTFADLAERFERYGNEHPDDPPGYELLPPYPQ